MKKSHLLAIDHLDVGCHMLYRCVSGGEVAVASSTPMAPALSWGLDWPHPSLGRTKEPVPGQTPAGQGQ